MPAVQLALEHEPGAHARPDGEEDEVRDATRNTGPALAEGREVDVVLEGDWESQTLMQVFCEGPPLEALDVGGEPELAGARLHDSRDADDGPVNEVAVEPARLHERVAERGSRGERFVHVGRAELDVLSCPHIPNEVADGAAQEARAEVEAEHERGLRHRFEVDSAVTRAMRRRAGLADEPSLEERLQRQRDRRLGDSGTPGDLRPRDGRAEAYRLEDGALVESPKKRRNGAIGHLVRDSNAQPPRCTVDRLDKACKSRVS